MRHLLWLGLVMSPACFAPSPQAGAPCVPAAGNCPAGQSCVASATGFVCSYGDGLGIDAGGDAPADARPDASGFCFGKGLVSEMCFTQPPSGMLSVTASATIDTATVGGAHCTEIRAQSGGPSLCVVAKQTIELKNGVTLRAVGPNPLVLIASGMMTLDGVLDVSSKRGATVTGAG